MTYSRGTKKRPYKRSINRANYLRMVRPAPSQIFRLCPQCGVGLHFLNTGKHNCDVR